jgi:hypothetical protein
MAERGDHAGAEAEFRDVLAARLRVLGRGHRSTLNTRHEIAAQMAARGDHAGAEAEFRDVLAAEVRVLGAEHPYTRRPPNGLRILNGGRTPDVLLDRAPSQEGQVEPLFARQISFRVAGDLEHLHQERSQTFPRKRRHPPRGTCINCGQHNLT